MSSKIHASEIIVQEMIEGGASNLFSYATFFDGKKVVAGMSARRWRQHPMVFGKATTYAETVRIPELENLSMLLLKEIGYFGLAEVEFMWDEREKCYKFLEINGRPWGWHTLLKASGLNLPFLLYQFMNGNQIDHPTPVEGVKWMRLITDIPTFFIEIINRRMKLNDYYKSFKGKKEFAVLSFKDPLPFFIELILIPYLWRKRGY